MIKINGIEFLSTQFIGVGVLNVRVPDRGELRAHSTDWILKHNENVLIVSDAMYQELLKGELLHEMASDALASDELGDAPDATLPTIDEIKHFLIDLGFAVGIEENGTIIAKPEPPIEVVSQETSQEPPKSETNEEMMKRLGL